MNPWLPLLNSLTNLLRDVLKAFGLVWVGKTLKEKEQLEREARAASKAKKAKKKAKEDVSNLTDEELDSEVYK